MAKNKHQQLAKYMQVMLHEIEVHKEIYSDNAESFLKNKLLALLYCPVVEEILNVIDWYKVENAINFNVIHSLTEYQTCMYLIQRNALNDSYPIWEESIEIWLDPCEKEIFDGSYERAHRAINLDKLDFAPHKDLSLALGYEKVMMSTRKHKSKHRNPLRNIYKRMLEEAIFENVDCSEEEKRSFFKHWEIKFFNYHKQTRSKPGRWKQSEGIDCYEAALFIKYFIDEFIDDLNNKKLGEIACILWLLIWIAQQNKSDQVSITDILNLCSTDLDSQNKIIYIDTLEVNISWGLHRLLSCLIGKGNAIRSRRLFENLDIEGKALNRALQEASKDLLGEGCKSVSPGAFLVFPHLYPGERISATDLEIMRQTS